MVKISKKLSYGDVKNYTENRGYILESDNYNGVHSKLTISDKYGYFYYITISNFKKYTPPKFHKNNIYTSQNIRLWLKLNNKPYGLLSENYINAKEKLKWKCLSDKCGEIFETSWDKLQSGVGCSYCSNKTIGFSNCLQKLNPSLVKEWDYEKNKYITPYDVGVNSNKEIWWQCDKGHSWKAPVNNRNKGSNCPYCSGFYASEDYNLYNSNPILCKEWDYEKNLKNPNEYTPYSSESVWWKCKYGHSWKTSIYHRNRENNGCPYCSGRYSSDNYNLLKNNPELCKEWDYSKNKKSPKQYTPNSGKKAWWKCKECGHEWRTYIYSRNVGGGCPECNISKGEKRIKQFLIKNKIFYIPQKEFDDLIGVRNGKLSYDFYLSQHNLLIEYQGEFHDGTAYQQNDSQFKTQQEHDKRKNKYAKENGYKLIEIWYYEFDKIEEILLKHLLPQQKIS